MTDTARTQLVEVMDQARARLGLKWQDIARRGGISVALLRNIRNGTAPLTLDSIAAIERAYEWPPGTVEAILAGDQRVIDAARSVAPIRRSHYPPELYERTARDETEQDMLLIRHASEEMRWSFIFDRRERLYDEGIANGHTQTQQA